MADPNERVRLYRCPGCQAFAVRPTADPGLPGVPFPKPCDVCGHALNRSPWTETTAAEAARLVTKANPKTLTNLTPAGGGNVVLVVVADDLRRKAALDLFPVELGYYVVVGGQALGGYAHDFVIYTPRWNEKLTATDSALWRELEVLARFRDPKQRNELHLT